MSFFKTPEYLKILYPGLLWDNYKGQYLPTTEKHVFITFDDGPVEGVTDFALKTLASYQAKASFFCVGDNIEKNPGVYRSILNEGHTTGNHTFNHLNGWKTKNNQYIENISECQALIESGKTPGPISKTNFFRPPYGKIKRSQIRSIKKNYKIVMWDILAGDFDEDFNAEKCLKKCIKHTKSGSIIIFHDSKKASKNLSYVLPRYLDYLKNNDIHTYPL